MRSARVLIDTGPLVALFSERDPAHERCAAAMVSLPRPPLTCWPVITEAAWLLRNSQAGLEALFDTVEQEPVELAVLGAGDLSGVRERMSRFQALRPQFADACLVHLAEREGIDTIFTLDRRDFSVYRTRRGKAFRLLPTAD